MVPRELVSFVFPLFPETTSRGKHQDSRENKTNCFPRDHTLSVYWSFEYQSLEHVSWISFISTMSELNKEFPAVWLVEWFRASQQVNMADSCDWISHLFGRHYCKSRIFERMENFQNDCCRPWTKKLFKNSYSRQSRIVNAVVSWSPAGQIYWPKFVFSQTKATHFETMMTTVDEVNRDKTKVPN